jgi:hypothetical protein
MGLGQKDPQTGRLAVSHAGRGLGQQSGAMLGRHDLVNGQPAARGAPGPSCVFRMNRPRNSSSPINWSSKLSACSRVGRVDGIARNAAMPARSAAAPARTSTLESRLYAPCDDRSQLLVHERQG